jgi:small subunit ribosomal protein S21
LKSALPILIGGEQNINSGDTRCDRRSSLSAVEDTYLRRLFVVKLRLRDNENINDAVKRFRKLVEHAGIKKEMRRREYYEKPSDEKRRARRRAERRNKLQRLSGGL